MKYLKIFELNKISQYYKDNQDKIEKFDEISYDYYSGHALQLNSEDNDNINKSNEKHFKLFIDHFSRLYNVSHVEFEAEFRFIYDQLHRGVDYINNMIQGVVKRNEASDTIESITTYYGNLTLPATVDAIKKDFVEYYNKKLSNIPLSEVSLSNSRIKKLANSKGLDYKQVAMALGRLSDYRTASFEVDINSKYHGILNKLTVDKKSIPKILWRGIVITLDDEETIEKWAIGTKHTASLANVSSWSTSKSVALGFLEMKTTNDLLVLLKYENPQINDIVADTRVFTDERYWGEQEIIMNNEIEGVVSDIFNNDNSDSDAVDEWKSKITSKYKTHFSSVNKDDVSNNVAKLNDYDFDPATKIDIKSGITNKVLFRKFVDRFGWTLRVRKINNKFINAWFDIGDHPINTTITIKDKSIYNTIYDIRLDTGQLNNEELRSAVDTINNTAKKNNLKIYISL